MTVGWTFDELLTNGWFPHWQPGERPYRLEFTWYRSEIARHTVEATGATMAEAQADAAARANAWLAEHPEFQPKRPPSAARRAVEKG
jgi:uncharacterized protein (DUF2235 family)